MNGFAVLLLTLIGLGGGGIAAQEGASTAPAFDLTGEWTLNVMSPNGAGTRDLTLVQEGATLTGEISSSMAAGIVRGTIEGDVVSFVAEILMDSGVFAVTYRATWADGELVEGTVEFGDYGSGTFTGHRKEEGGHTPLR